MANQVDLVEETGACAQSGEACIVLAQEIALKSPELAFALVSIQIDLQSKRELRWTGRPM